jgi:hypothetical protein
VAAAAAAAVEQNRVAVIVGASRSMTFCESVQRSNAAR